MIYIFGKQKNLSIVFDESILSEQDKVEGIPVKELPLRKDKVGYNTILVLDETNNLYWEYEEIKEEKTEEEKSEETPQE
jgi:hypothetical protein